MSLIGSNIKLIALVVLVVQNASQVLVMRYSRIAAPSGPPYLASTAVLMGEFMKLFVCLYLTWQEHGMAGTQDLLHLHIVKNRLETLKLLVPAALYTLQNNLLYIAVSNLDPAIFQVTYQVKILTTALFTVFMLSKKLSRYQWISLVILMLGVIQVQLSQMSDGGKPAKSDQNPFLGLCAVLAACVSSGFAGVYFEKILKSNTSGSNSIPAPSIWMRNIQLAIFSIGLAVIPFFTSDFAVVRRNGIFQGFNFWTWSSICLSAGGGLIVAVVVKYADNIAKGFATSIAIVVSCIASAILFEFQITFKFTIGAFLVIAAAFIYGTNPYVEPTGSNKKDLALEMNETKSLIMKHVDRSDTPTNSGADKVV
jgi:UDP-sugar transporter A1/2/3